MRGNEGLLVLTHQGLPNHNDLLGISGGWHGHLDVLVEHLNGRTSSGFWSAHAALNTEYRERLRSDDSVKS